MVNPGPKKTQTDDLPIDYQESNGADGGGRTHTLLRVPDFESGASANSATSATMRQYILSGNKVNKFHSPGLPCPEIPGHPALPHLIITPVINYCSTDNSMTWGGMGCAHLATMEHRKQAIDTVGLIAHLAGFIVLISLFFPAVRRVLAELGFLAVCFSIFFVTGLIGFNVYRLTTRRSKAMTENPFAPPAENPNQIGKDVESENAPNLLEPSLRRRYPWRHETADPL